MARCLETAEQLRKEVESFITTELTGTRTHEGPEVNQVAARLGHIVNLAVRCNPRQSQGTVRKNIVAIAMRDYCKVTMTRETDEITGYEFNQICIRPKD